MAGEGYLPDTCAWIAYFSPKGTPLGDRLAELLAGGASVFTCGPVLYELLQGVRTDGERESILSALDALPFLETGREAWLAAGGISSGLRREGITIPSSDILIGALALGHGLEILTVDPHFARIAGVRVSGA